MSEKTPLPQLRPSTFMNANIDNIQILCRQNEEKESRIRELEERLQQVKIDERSLQSFKINVLKRSKQVGRSYH
jgi:cell division septum initiation protein DivIVA